MPSAVGGIVGSVFGGGNDFDLPTIGDVFVPFSGGGLNATLDGGTINVGADPVRTGLVGRSSRLFRRQAGELGRLRSQLAPGVDKLTKTALAQIENQRLSTVSNLEEDLARRNVLGSSFAQDAISRTEAEFAQKAAEVATNTFLLELQEETKLLEKQFQAAQNAVGVNLNELNMQAQLAANLSTSTQQALTGLAQTMARIQLEENKLAGQFFGQLGSEIFDIAGDVLGSDLLRSVSGGSGGSGGIDEADAAKLALQLAGSFFGAPTI